MKKVTVLAVTSLFAATLMVAEAQAKRRGFSIPFVIPGFGSSESIELVKDLPNIDALRRPDGTYIDLGYLHKRSGGKWVGYVGSKDTYVDFSPESLKVLMSLSGMSALPPVPKKKSILSSSSGGGGSLTWILALLGAGFVVYRIFKASRNMLNRGARALGNASQTLSGHDTFHDDASQPQSARLEERMAAAAQAYAAGTLPPQSSTQTAPGYRPLFGQQGAATFGRR
jgi:hypothetical protein